MWGHPGVFNLTEGNSPELGTRLTPTHGKSLFSALGFICGIEQCCCFVRLSPCFSGGLNSADTGKAFLLSQREVRPSCSFSLGMWVLSCPTKHLSPGSEKLGLSLLEGTHFFRVVITGKTTFLS